MRRCPAPKRSAWHPLRAQPLSAHPACQASLRALWCVASTLEWASAMRPVSLTCDTSSSNSPVRHPLAPFVLCRPNREPVRRSLRHRRCSRSSHSQAPIACSSAPPWHRPWVAVPLLARCRCCIVRCLPPPRSALSLLLLCLRLVSAPPECRCSMTSCRRWSSVATAQQATTRQVSFPDADEEQVKCTPLLNFHTVPSPPHLNPPFLSLLLLLLLLVVECCREGDFAEFRERVAAIDTSTHKNDTARCW